jgi:hypothetical protein
MGTASGPRRLRFGAEVQDHDVGRPARRARRAAGPEALVAWVSPAGALTSVGRAGERGYNRAMAVRSKTKQATECRQCRSFCDKTIQPRGCIEANCPFLYTYEDEKTGRSYIGCLQKVFDAEIDVEMFSTPSARAGYGGVKAKREPLDVPVLGRALLRGNGRAFDCVNPRFFDAADGEPAATARSTCATASDAAAVPARELHWFGRRLTKPRP